MNMKRDQPGWRRRLAAWLLPLFCLLVVVVIGSVSVGSADLSVGSVWKIIMSRFMFAGSIDKDWTQAAETIVWEIRLPRIVLAVLVGAGLGAAGTAYQGVLRNPLADPYILGVSSGASVGAAAFILFGSGWSIVGSWTLPFVAFLCGLVTLFVVYRLASINGTIQVETLLLSGVVVQSFLGAGLSLLISLSREKIQDIVYWMMGSLALADWQSVIVIAPYVLGGIAVMWLCTRELNILALGEQKAHHLGMNVQRIRLVLLVTASLAAGATVAVSGVIGFVGLIIPHMMRSIVGSDYRVLLPVSAVAGSILLVMADTIARTILDPQELPIGVITAFLGAPFFAYLLRRRRKNF